MECGPGRGERLDPLFHFGVVRRIDQQERGTQPGDVLHDRRNARIVGERIVDRHGLCAVALRDLRRCAKAGQDGVAARAGARDFEERLFRVLRLAFAAKLHRRFEARAGGFGRSLLLALVKPPAARGEYDQDGKRDDPVLIPLPSLYGFVAAVLFLDLADEVSHVGPVEKWLLEAPHGNAGGRIPLRLAREALECEEIASHPIAASPRIAHEPMPRAPGALALRPALSPGAGFFAAFALTKVGAVHARAYRWRGGDVWIEQGRRQDLMANPGPGLRRWHVRQHRDGRHFHHFAGLARRHRQIGRNHRPDHRRGWTGLPGGAVPGLTAARLWTASARATSWSAA